MKFGTKISSNMENSMVVLIFSILDWKHPFFFLQILSKKSNLSF